MNQKVKFYIGFAGYPLPKATITVLYTYYHSVRAQLLDPHALEDYESGHGSGDKTQSMRMTVAPKECIHSNKLLPS